jgi:hypothetical protein
MKPEEQLRELTDSWREAGVSLPNVIGYLNAEVTQLTGEGALEEQAEHAEEDDDTS